MPDTEQDVNSPPTSPGVRLLCQWKKAGQPITLMLNGTVEFSVQDDRSFELLEDLVDRLDCLDALRTARRELDEGKGLTLEQVGAEFRKGYEIPN